MPTLAISFCAKAEQICAGAAKTGAVALRAGEVGSGENCVPMETMDMGCLHVTTKETEERNANPGTWRLRQEGCEFQGSLGYMWRHMGWWDEDKCLLSSVTNPNPWQKKRTDKHMLSSPSMSM